MGNYRSKPMPDESIYKHLRMLAIYCESRAIQESDPENKAPNIMRGKAFHAVALKLDKLSNSKEVEELQFYGA